MGCEHGGNLSELARRAGRSRADILDFSANINPLGPPESLRTVISGNVSQLVHYPDPDAAGLIEAISRRYGIPVERIIVGNGSMEVLYALVRAVGLRRAVIPAPTYIDYAAAARLERMEVCTLKLKESEGFALDWESLGSQVNGRDIVFLGQPNNPTGLLLDVAKAVGFAAGHPQTVIVVDEAFADFSEGYETLARIAPPNLVVLRSLTKFYAIPGLRLGFAAAEPALARRIRQYIPTWSVNTLAQAAGIAVLADDDYARASVQYVIARRKELIDELRRFPGLHVCDGAAANFLLVRLTGSHLTAPALAEKLLLQGIAIRIFGRDQYLDERYFRIAVRTEAENTRLVEALAAALGVPHRGAAKERRTAALMFQGTSSSAGKSVLTAAMCRILLQDGVRVAPFKAQNMSLNSFVTRDGLEMGRAQVVQAQACRLEPDVRMNPVLLKPNSDTGSQVIMRGRALGNMNAGECLRHKPQALAAARECYDSLAAEFDAIVLEGAGSPGEVNLKRHDIVNMSMARHAGAPVLIVGDIDRGGVFASFVGTAEVLAEWERTLLAGWVINRFRGDETLLGSALDYTLAHTGQPVLGVVPFLSNLNIPQEDSVEFKSGVLDTPGPNAAVEIAVVDLPHISNFTDFDAFGIEPDVRVRIVRSAEELGHPDAVMVPGSKNTLNDLRYLKSIGLADRIAHLATEGASEIVGICGGLQMLGRRIRDPECIESSDGEAEGLGLLSVDTVLTKDKTLTRVTASHALSGHEVFGYEIHHGQTVASNRSEHSEAPFMLPDGRMAGAGNKDHRVWGTYIHGVFDADGFRRWFIDSLRVRRGLAALGKIAARYDIEPALERLAAVVRRSLNMSEIYRLMGLR